jgi:hypothetical protein
MKIRTLVVLLLLAVSSFGQISDDFSDGNFTTNPTWSGTNADFIVNASQELQISNTVAATSYLSLPHTLSTLDNQEWKTTVRMSFSPSSSNFSRIYLTSTAADLSTNPDGYYILLGEAGSTDAVRLMKSQGGVPTQICASPDGQISSSVNVGLRVVRDNLGNWELYVDPAGGINYGAPYTGIDPSALLGTHFGFLGIYTVSNATKFYFDNVYIGPEILDTQAPSIVSSQAISATQVDVLYSEAVTGLFVINAGNYVLSPLVTVLSATLDGSNNALVHLTLSSNLQNGQTYQLTATQAEDLSGNVATNLVSSFTYLVSDTPVKGDILINEFVADQTPSIGLPEVEYVEIYNRSNKYFDLSGWKLGDASADGTITSGWIYPGQYKILCSSASLDSLPGALTVTSFPSLNNSGDDIVLRSPALAVIDRISYTDDWYRDEIKKQGGYSLELINPNDPCSDASNWIASTAAIGGTPGLVNSVLDLTPDTQVPSILSAVALMPNFIEFTFSEGMDSTSVVNALFSSNPALTISSMYVAQNGANTAIATLNENLVPNTNYIYVLNNIADCWMNVISISATFAVADNPMPGDVVVNEILFDPGTGGSDFIELYNRSNKILNLKDFTLANYDNDTIANFKVIADNYLLQPGDYVVLTADSLFVKNQFPFAINGKFYQMSLPTLNNDSSTVYLIYNSEVLDKVSYTDDWHLSLIDDTENKTLERIDPNGISNNSMNWHTAAESVNFGTPGRVNSQLNLASVDGTFSSTEPIFSPDNDGLQDVILFTYELAESGHIADLKIYDDKGRLVRKLAQSELLGTSGVFSWDGVRDDDLKAPIGVYIAVFETFKSDGSAQLSKRAVFTLAGKI